MKKIFLVLLAFLTVLFASTMLFASYERQADRVSYNVSKEADNFTVNKDD